MSILIESKLPIPITYRGKVRDTYDLGDRLLFVATDRISAFDVVLPCGIPDKGMVLNQLSAFWFDKTRHIIANHVLDTIDNKEKLKHISSVGTLPDILIGRSMLVKKARRVPVEAVVRGYLSGSAWEEYKKNGTISGKQLDTGLVESEKLSEPIFTPTTKADSGHDLPLNEKQLRNLLGDDIAEKMEEYSKKIYKYALGYTLGKGIIIADTKFEFGFDNKDLILIDELITPDSSRFWDANSYSPGKPQPSFDKQPVRDWLTATGWNKEPPAPMLPEDIIRQTSERYKTAYRILVGMDIKTV